MADTNADCSEQIVTLAQIDELIKEVDPTIQLDEEIGENIRALIDDFVDKVVNGACLMAKHRLSSTIEVKDIQLYLKRAFNICIPGFGTEILGLYKRNVFQDTNRDCLLSIRKEMKKNSHLYKF